MADEEKNEQQETEASEAEAPAEELAAEEPSEAPAEEEGAAEDEAPAEEPVAEEAPAAAEPAAEAAPADEGEEAAPLTPKQLRKQERTRHTGEARPQRSPEERADERRQRRAAKTAARGRRRVAERVKRTPGTGTPPAEREPGTKMIRQGTVVSDKADKTITVRLEIVRRHPRYEKIVRQSATVHAHDENNDANTGDVVRVIESRPRSRTKRWRLVEVLERAR
jgi:small subunit ribosomal protein S17